MGQKLVSPSENHNYPPPREGVGPGRGGGWAVGGPTLLEPGGGRGTAPHVDDADLPAALLGGDGQAADVPVVAAAADAGHHQQERLRPAPRPRAGKPNGGVGNATIVPS